MLSEDLLTLQRLDTSVDQDVYRRAHLAEREAAMATERALTVADRRRAAIESRDAELEAAVESLERDAAAIAQQRARLEGQLRTVSSTRQAEALEHELGALAARRDELDDHELAHLEEQSSITAERDQLDTDRPGVAAAADQAAGVLSAVEGAIDAELAAHRSARHELAAQIDRETLDRYERLRARYGGVAVGALEGTRCSGCHLDLSAAEVEAVRTTPPGQVADCPQCGRLLVP